MHFSPMVKVDLALDQRIERLVKEYALFTKEELTHAISKITKRLGGDNAKHAVEAIERGDFHEATRILLWYYDKAYNRSIEERRSLIEFEKVFSEYDAEAMAIDVVKVLKS